MQSQNTTLHKKFNKVMHGGNLIIRCQIISVSSVNKFPETGSQQLSIVYIRTYQSSININLAMYCWCSFASPTSCCFLVAKWTWVYVRGYPGFIYSEKREASPLIHELSSQEILDVSVHWTRLLDWNTGLELSLSLSYAVLESESRQNLILYTW